MYSNVILRMLAVTCTGALLAACSDESSLTAPDEPDVARATKAAAVSLEPPPEPFSIRAPLDAFFINQAPEMMIRSKARADFAIQLLVTAPGPGGWHTHPGPSFGIVQQGRVMITRYTKKEGCVSTVYGPEEPAGAAYFEVADEVHRATVLGTVDAVEYKARFYVPEGEPFGKGAPDPAC